MQRKYHAVVRLPVHDENQQQVLYKTTDNIADVIRRASVTKLTAFFALCARDDVDGNFAKMILYHEVPIHFVWKKGKQGIHAWHRRQRRGDKTIGRMIAVSPQDINRYYLRLLLLSCRTNVIHGFTNGGRRCSPKL